MRRALGSRATLAACLAVALCAVAAGPAQNPIHRFSGHVKMRPAIISEILNLLNEMRGSQALEMADPECLGAIDRAILSLQ